LWSSSAIATARPSEVVPTHAGGALEAQARRKRGAGAGRFHNSFDGAIVDGPFAGGRISGPDFFVLRPDGVGEIHAPELIEYGAHRVALDVRGYVVPPDGAPVPPLAALLEPGFEFPDVPFRVTGSAFASTTSPEFADLNRVTIVVEGEVNMGTGVLDVTARTVERAAP
jgi:hypothetical protein